MIWKRKRAALAESEANAMVQELVDGAAKVFQNAAGLYSEASALHAAGALSRALFLHQISLEECAKIEMLGAWGTGILMGMETDVQKRTAAFASHKAKNYTNAYLLPVTKTESDARREKRWQDAQQAFKKQQAEFHLESNTAKNASLYVDIQNGVFVAPKERITEEMVAKIARANDTFLAGAQAKVEMMTRWLVDLDKTRTLLKGLESRLMEVLSRSDDPEKGLYAFLDEMLNHAKDIGYYEAMPDSDSDKTEK